MKQIFSRDFWHLPDFMKNERLRLVALLLLGLSLTGTIMAFVINLVWGFVILLLVLVVIILAYGALRQITESTNEYLSDLSYRIKRGEQDALIKMPIGVLFFNENAEIEWVNPTLQRYFGKNDVLGKSINEVDEQLAQMIVKYKDEKHAVEVELHNGFFNLLIQNDIHAVYLMEVTHYAKIQQRYDNSRLVIGQIFLDNYDEVTKSLNDKAISNLSNYVTNALSDWARQFKMFLKRVDDDHYFFIAYTQALNELEKEKFKVLDRIRESTSKRNSPLTLSMGIAYGNENLAELSTLSQSNLDLALGRGGDQVVVREIDGQARFYGGKTNPMEKRTRVRARMISQALQELIHQSDQVFVIGHKRPDMDSIGACLGIRRIAAMNKKDCEIVLDQENLHSDIERLLSGLQQYPEIRNKIISPEEAMEKATKHSLLIMVDHSKPSISISKELYEKMKNRVMVIDHHRRGEEFPENPILVYIEPYASSTCELITEMFEYQSRETEPINKIEATAMLTGIIIDTKSFSIRTGTRTFDAASYLRSVGADLGMTRHFMKESVDSYLQRNHLIDRVEFVEKGNAVVAGEESKSYDPVVAAQAADSLLNISGVEASYVITRRADGQIGISARSNGNINVQVIMEKMGGGGHLSNAATQISGGKITDTTKELLEILVNERENEEEAE
ncbi:DHH family phosphoesterase [Ligilactobacillus sp. WILCCON 0076]|uniref:Cyclic-di-AMP phosphodiesterase n=1 Tax=Ligilactobacillus ubinensis TaxID=2876789 RepID=A0A9X2JLQ3_9LACO|nr:DHH family phosphoesterase [Ligilactobacillus ubinensis]MCP0887144.1 DHH family phosphoesterase [Ligilactobacillus ubinensis]